MIFQVSELILENFYVSAGREYIFFSIEKNFFWGHTKLCGYVDFQEEKIDDLYFFFFLDDFLSNREDFELTHSQ